MGRAGLGGCRLHAWNDRPGRTARPARTQHRDGALGACHADRGSGRRGQETSGGRAGPSAQLQDRWRPLRRLPAVHPHRGRETRRRARHRRAGPGRQRSRRCASCSRTPRSFHTRAGTASSSSTARRRMTGEAANCLLKTLEEPPDNVYLILLTQQPAALLPTVRSRCRLIEDAPRRRLPDRRHAD